jgi:hypothetical protein
MDWYKQQMKIDRVEFKLKKTALLKEFNDTTKQLAGKMQSQFLLVNKDFDSCDNQELFEGDGVK